MKITDGVSENEVIITIVASVDDTDSEQAYTFS